MCKARPLTKGGHGVFANDDSHVRGRFVDAGFEQVDVGLVEVIVALPPEREYFPEHMKAMPWAERSRLSATTAPPTGIEAPFRVFRAIAAA